MKKRLSISKSRDQLATIVDAIVRNPTLIYEITVNGKPKAILKSIETETSIQPNEAAKALFKLANEFNQS